MPVLEWLEKATLTTDDLNTNGGLLVAEQAVAFLRVAIDSSVIMKEARVETSANPKFEVPRISFANRILRPGTEGSRLLDADRVEPGLGLITLSTYLFRGEVPVSDEVFEDNIERAALADTLMTMIAEAIGRDVEEIAIKSDTARVAGDNEPVFDVFDGIIKQLESDLPSAQKIDASTHTSYETTLGNAVAAMPTRYLGDYTALRFYVPFAHIHQYQRTLAARGTGLGDTAVTDAMLTKLAYRGIPVVGVPMLSGTGTINGSTKYYDRQLILTHPKNIIFGFHRRIQVERFRDPREGVTSFLPSVRFDVKFADPNAAVLVYNANAANYTS